MEFGKEPGILNHSSLLFFYHSFVSEGNSHKGISTFLRKNLSPGKWDDTYKVLKEKKKAYPEYSIQKTCPSEMEQWKPTQTKTEGDYHNYTHLESIKRSYLIWIERIQFSIMKTYKNIYLVKICIKSTHNTVIP